MKTQVMQNKKGSESRSNAESIGSSGTSQLMANVSNSPKMAAQRKQKDNVQLAAKKKEVQKKGDEKKKK